jgi:hypothetical protein
LPGGELTILALAPAPVNWHTRAHVPLYPRPDSPPPSAIDSRAPADLNATMSTSPENPLTPAQPALSLVGQGRSKDLNGSGDQTPTPEITLNKLDSIFAEAGVALPSTGKELTLVGGVEERLASAETVEQAMPLIAEMAKVEKESKGVRVYPRVLLRIQHVAAFVIMNPFCSNTDIAKFFHVGPTCIANIMKTDTFKSLVDAHRVSLDGLNVDIQEQMRTTLIAGLEVVSKEITERQDGDFALSAVDKIANRLGMGGKHNSAPNNIQINNIITADMIAAARARRLPDGA